MTTGVISQKRPGSRSLCSHFDLLPAFFLLPFWGLKWCTKACFCESLHLQVLIPYSFQSVIVFPRLACLLTKVSKRPTRVLLTRGSTCAWITAQGKMGPFRSHSGPFRSHSGPVFEPQAWCCLPFSSYVAVFIVCIYEVQCGH